MSTVKCDAKQCKHNSNSNDFSNYCLGSIITLEKQSQNYGRLFNCITFNNKEEKENEN
jgi:hypothetical protein